MPIPISIFMDQSPIYCGILKPDLASIAREVFESRLVARTVDLAIKLISDQEDGFYFVRRCNRSAEDGDEAQCGGYTYQLGRLMLGAGPSVALMVEIGLSIDASEIKLFAPNDPVKVEIDCSFRELKIFDGDYGLARFVVEQIGNDIWPSELS